MTIKLGTNDSRLPYRLQIDSFTADYKTLIHSFKKLPSHPPHHFIIACIPLYPCMNTMRQTEQAIARLIRPRIKQVAYEENLEVIDLHSITTGMPEVFPDNLHPTSAGAGIIARRLFEAITLQTAFDYNIFLKYDPWYKVSRTLFTISNFHGYVCADFTFQGRKAKIVRPRHTAKGKPWIWRARFWGVEPQTDIALLERGFHLVYCDVAELFGNAEAIDIWNKFYDRMKRAGLSKKPVWKVSVAAEYMRI